MRAAHINTQHRWILSFLLLIFYLSLTLATGCALKRKELGTRFFPPPPVPPKIQFLKKISNSLDVERISAMESFVGGEIQAKLLGKPYGIAVHDGVIYVCDVEFGLVWMIDLVMGSYTPLPGRGPGKLKRPITIAIHDDGTKYVSDYGRHQVVVFDKENQYIRTFGNKDQFKPSGVTVFEDRLFVSDTRDHEVEVLDRKTGDLLEIIGGPGIEEGEFNYPTNLSFDGKGNLYVTDTINCRVQVFDTGGDFLFSFGECGDGIGQFARPKGVGASKEGFSYVVDAAFENVQIFSPESELALFFGGFGEANVPGALWLPAGITITYDEKLLSFFDTVRHKDFIVEYLVLVVSQYGPPYVNVYAFGEAREGSPLAKGEAESAEPTEQQGAAPADLPDAESIK